MKHRQWPSVSLSYLVQLPVSWIEYGSNRDNTWIRVDVDDDCETLPRLSRPYGPVQSCEYWSVLQRQYLGWSVCLSESLENRRRPYVWESALDSGSQRQPRKREECRKLEERVDTPQLVSACFGCRERQCWARCSISSGGLWEMYRRKERLCTLGYPMLGWLHRNTEAFSHWNWKHPWEIWSREFHPWSLTTADEMLQF